MKEQQKSFLTKIIWCAILLFAIRCVISGENLISNFTVYGVWGYAGESIAATILLMTIYEKWIWRFIPFENTPKLYKHYDGIFISDYDGSERTASLIITQTLLTVKITLITGESRSKSVSASIDTILGEKQLTYCYINTPDAMVRNRSQMHYGTAMLCIENPLEICGQYFTDRKTTGDMKFKKKEEI